MMKWVFCTFLVACGGTGANSPDAGDGADGTTVDAALDAAVPTLCGGSLCRTDQTCVDDSCTFACAGTNVPGDYASLQTAIDALAAADADATICIGEVVIAGEVTIRDTGNHNRSLTIQGLSPAKTRIDGNFRVEPGWSTVMVKGLSVTSGINYPAFLSLARDTAVTVLASKITGRSGAEIRQTDRWLISDTDIMVGSEYGVTAYANLNDPLFVRIENSYIHGAGTSVSAVGAGQQVTLELVNNTILGAEIGCHLDGQTSALVANNLFSGLSVHALSWTSTTTVVAHHNAFWDNTSNYDGLASDGPSTLKVDCMLGTGSVPTLGPSSPCKDAGDAAVAPPDDFYGVARGSNPDLGAVESP